MLTETCEELVTTCAAPAYATVESEPADCRSQTDSCQSATHITVADHITDHVERLGLLAKGEYYAWASLKLTHGKFRSTHIDNIITGCSHVLYMDCTSFVAMVCRLLLCTLCSSLMQWPRYYAAPEWWVSLTPRIGIALRPLFAEQLSMVYCADTTPTLSSLCDKANRTLFDNIITNSTHLFRISYFHPK